jgi:hypothetical protein
MTKKIEKTYEVYGLYITVRGISTHSWGFDIITRLHQIVEESYLQYYYKKQWKPFDQ